MNSSEMTQKLSQYMNEDGYYVARKILQDFDHMTAYQAFFVNQNPDVAKFSAEYQFATAANAEKMNADHAAEIQARAEIDTILAKSDSEITADEWETLTQAGWAKRYAHNEIGYRRVGIVAPLTEESDGA